MCKYLQFTSFLLAAIIYQHCFASDDAIQAAFDELVAADHWREQSAASKLLADFGDEALPHIVEGTKHEDNDVREHCFQILYDHFVADARSHSAFIRGLIDDDHRISYSCALWLGKVGNEDAESALRDAMEQASGSHVRYAAAKSLAELGNEDVIVTLYCGLGNDRYMPRYLCNLGIKALTGKDLTDFGHDYKEGATILSGKEWAYRRPAVHHAELKASRFRAIAEYCRWLRDEKAEVYRLLDPRASLLFPAIEFRPGTPEEASGAWAMI